MLQATVGKDQAAHGFSRMGALARQKPVPSLFQRGDQRRTATGTQGLQPGLQGRRGLQAVALPLWRLPAGGEQGQPGALAVSLVEQGCQQPFGLRQRLMTTGGGRGIDNHQPQLCGPGLALLPAQVLEQPWPPLEQSRQPGHPTGRRTACPATAGPALLARARSGIRPFGRWLANAQGFFAQFGTSRRAPLATGCAGNAPQSPCPPCSPG